MRYVIVGFACTVMILALALTCQTADARDCGPDHVWVNGFETPDGTWVQGYCRPKARSGFRWIDTHQTPNGYFIPAHWEPTEPPPPGKIWVPGYYGPKGQWVPGRWK